MRFAIGRDALASTLPLISGMEDFSVPDTTHSPDSYEPRLGRSVSLEHAAQLLHVSRRTIYNRIRDGRLQTIRTLGGSQRVLLDSLNGLETPDVTKVSVPDAAPASIART